MDEEKVLFRVKEISEKVKTTSYITIAIVFLVVLILPIHYTYRIIIVLAVTLVSFLITRKIKMSADDILYDECDPHTYYAVSHGIYPKDSTSYIDALTAYFIGDFGSAAGLLSTLLKRKSIRTVKLQYLDLLASVSFCAGDFDLCRQTVDALKALLTDMKIKADIRSIYSARYDFFIHFMNCDYQSALERLKGCKAVGADKQKNTYKFMMCYYTAIALYYSNKIPEARAEFELIAKLEPKIFVTEKAKDYINAIDNNEFMPINSVSLKESCEQASDLPVLTREDKRKLKLSVCFLALCVGFAVICTFEMPELKRDTAFNVIHSEVEISEVSRIIPLDDEYSLATFSTTEDEIGVAYLKNRKNDKYSYYISYVATPEIYCEKDNGYYITARGDAKMVYFDITDDLRSIPENCEIKGFTHNGKEYYLYITDITYEYTSASTCGVYLE